MASELSAKASIHGLARTFFSVLEPGTTSLNRTGLHPRHLLDTVKNIIHDGYHAATRYYPRRYPNCKSSGGMYSVTLNIAGPAVTDLLPSQSITSFPTTKR